MDAATHYAYPRTPHIQGSAVVDDDAALDTRAAKALIARADRVVVQEKVDGTNVGVHFEQDWVVVCQKRSGLIGQGEHVQYQRFREWAFDNVEMLWGALGLRYVLFGEWLLARHGVTYNALPSYFLAFDVYDKETASWLSTAAMEALVKPAGIETVPVLSTTWGGSVAELEALVGKSRYSTDQTAEGVYLRFEKDDKVFERLKYRRKTFVAGREDFHKALVTNTLLG